MKRRFALLLGGLLVTTALAAPTAPSKPDSNLPAPLTRQQLEEVKGKQLTQTIQLGREAINTSPPPFKPAVAAAAGVAVAGAAVVQGARWLSEQADPDAKRQPTPNNNPENFAKQRGDQGYREIDTGLTWKKDRLHKDHWDISDRDGDKVKEVDFEGRQIWPGGPKNKNK